MDKKYYGILLIVIMLVLAGIGWAASHVGNISIRRVTSTETAVAMNVDIPLVPGVPSVVHYLPAAGHGEAVQFFLRTASGTVSVGDGILAARQASIQIPCTSNERAGTLEMLDTASQELMAHVPVTLLPDGPDCLR